MNYRLGIDLGTTYTAAAVLVEGGAPEPVTLGEHGDVIPTVAYLSAERGLCFGDEAEAAALEHPERVARHFKRRVGDPVPLVLGTEAAIHAHDLCAAMITWVAAVVAEQREEPADAIAVTYPAGWSAHQRDLLRSALIAQGLECVDLVTEPEAAAIGYSYTGLISHPSKLAVYDLGGGTLDVALLATTEAGGFTRLGSPRGIAELGGIDFDDVLLRHLLTVIGGDDWGTDEDPLLRAELAALRTASVHAKETLSEQDEVALTMTVDGSPREITITRADFESWIDPLVAISIRFFTDSVADAGLYTDQLSWVLLTGGSAQVPLVTEALAEALESTVSIVRALDPKAMVAAGAALAVDRTPLASLPGARSDAPAPGAFVPGPRSAADALDARNLASFGMHAPVLDTPGIDALGLALMGTMETPGEVSGPPPLRELPGELPTASPAAAPEPVAEDLHYEVGPDVLDSLPPAPLPRRPVPSSTRIPGLTDSPSPLIPGSIEAAARLAVQSEAAPEAADAVEPGSPLPAPASHRGPRRRSKPAAVLAALKRRA
ncbi:MAG: Hsp70 family protein [Sporichthyaceae bacterium]